MMKAIKVFYVNEVTFGLHLGGGLVAREMKHVIGGLDLSAPPT